MEQIDATANSVDTNELDINVSSTSGDVANATGIVPKYYYHSCTVAKKIKKSLTKDQQKKEDALSVYIDGKKVSVPKKFEVCVIYSSNTSKKLRVRKVKFGYYGDVDREACGSAEFAKMRQKFEKLLIDSNQFDNGTFEKTGSFFNPKFWDINVQWLSAAESSQEGYIKLIDDFLSANFGQ